MRLKARLMKLERAVPSPVVPHLWLAFADNDELVLDDGTEACRPWVGRHYSELPAPVKIIGGIDPRLVLGDAPGPDLAHQRRASDPV